MRILDVFGVYDFLVRDSLILVVVGLSVYVLFNAGLFGVPQIGLMAVGAYTAALLATELDMPLFVTLVGGAAAGATAGLLLGLALARLNGVYLAIATIGFAEMVRVTARNLDITGGPVGLVGIPRSINDVHIVGVVIAAGLGLTLLNRTRHGGAMAAMREDALMAAHQGINTRVYRTALFVLSGLLAGLAGAMNVHLTGFIEPAAFSFDRLTDVLAATIVGGMTAVAGPFVGALVVFGLAEALRDLGIWRHVANGVLIVLIVAYTPAGVSSHIGAAARAIATRVGRFRTSGEHGGGPVARPARVASTGPSSDAPTGGVASSPDTGPLLRLTGMSKTFGGVVAADDVSIDVLAGEVFGLIGPNGSGKTTLLNLLSGVYRPDAGGGWLDGVDISRFWGHPERLAAIGLARTFQNIRLIDEYTVAENVRIGGYLPPIAQRATDGAASSIEDRVHAAMARVGVEDLATTRVDSLPYGLKRKVEIARALMPDPRILLLDEPTAGMSPREREEIFDLVQDIRAQGASVIVVEHDVASMTKHCDRVAVLNFGRVLAVGPAGEVTRRKEVIDAYIGRAS